jgi:hypothetical protein
MLVVTTIYDTLTEDAFSEAKEPHDVAFIAHILAAWRGCSLRNTKRLMGGGAY